MSIFTPPGERAVVVAFLRKHTNLRALATLIEDAAHWMPPAQLRAYCEKRGILLAEDEIKPT